MSAALCAVLITSGLLFAGAAQGKQAIEFIGGSGTLGGQFVGNPGAIAVNDSGAGAGNAGDIYAVDPGGNRIHRFARDDNGTSGNTDDDSYLWISTWGADVVSGGGTGDAGDESDANYEICTVAAECKAGVASGGNGTAAGNGALGDFGFDSGGIAVDGDTGFVYLADSGNHRVNVYAGDGAFLRSFGYSVVLSGPGDDLGAPDETQELTVNADGGKFSLHFRGAGTAPTGTGRIEPNNTQVKDVVTISGTFQVGQPLNSTSGNFPPDTTITAIDTEANTLTVSRQPLSPANSASLFSADIDFEATAGEVEDALNALPTIGGAGGSVSVGGPAGGPYEITFGGALSGEDLPPLSTQHQSLTLGAGTGSASVTTPTQGGAYEVCVAADGDVCRAGSTGPATGQIAEFARYGPLAISPADDDEAIGTVFLADAGNSRINTYDLDGQNPGSFGSSAEFDPTTGDREGPRGLAVDSRGIVYTAFEAANQNWPIARYDSQGVNGPVGFLDPIEQGAPEVQTLTVDATAGTYTLSFDGATTEALAFDASANQVHDALGALPTIGTPDSLSVSGTPNSVSGATITFASGRALDALDVPQITADDAGLSGGAGATTATTTQGQPGLIRSSGISLLAIDPDSDGDPNAGPDTDVLYALRGAANLAVQQFGPANPPGQTAPPAGEDERHAQTLPFSQPSGLAVEPSTERLYATAGSVPGFSGRGIYVMDDAGAPHTATLDSCDNVTATAIDCQATIDPNGPPLLRYRFEYSSDGGASWTSAGEVDLGTQDDPQAIDDTISPPPVGLKPNTEYLVRLIATKSFSPTVTTAALGPFTTLPAPPIVETTGAPHRTTTTARLGGRVNPRGSATDYRFEYGPTAAYGNTTSVLSTATEDRDLLVAREITGLESDTTYHYRLLADNGTGGEVAGADMTVTTRATEELPNQSDDFPGPPDSDRAWEQVSMPDSGGNPVSFGHAFSDAGDAAVFGVAGGTPISEAGGLFSVYDSRRPAGEHPTTGWQTTVTTPPRAQTHGQGWDRVFGPTDLSSYVSVNYEGVVGADPAYWRLAPGAPAQKLAELDNPQLASDWGGGTHNSFYNFTISADGSRVVARFEGGAGFDPAHPAAAAAPNVYDISSGGDPQLISLLPGDVVPACGATASSGSFASLNTQLANWVSEDGRLLYFPSRGDGPCSGPAQLYVRDLLAAQTKPISGSPVSGPACAAGLIKATPGAAFFTTNTRLDPEDEATAGCSGSNDVYRYDVAAEQTDCLTCLFPGAPVDVSGTNFREIAVAENGERIYFRTSKRLLPAAPVSATPSVYRLDVGSGELAYVATLIDQVGDGNAGADLTPDGSVLLFTSSNPSLNPAGEGLDNGGANQLYRYDDTDGSLVCVTCPLDGSAAPSSATTLDSGSYIGQPNLGFLAADGETIAFTTSAPLAPADQNGASGNSAVDAYEWRDGRQALLTDGQTAWSLFPRLEGISPSGNDIFFRATAAYTQDALDTSYRLYTARIGGGIDFPPPGLPPCDLNSGACEGPASSAPDGPGAGSAVFEGPQNPAKPVDVGDQGRDRCAKLAVAVRKGAATARRLRLRARRAARLARRTPNPGRSRALRRKARRYAKASRRRAAAAKRQRARAKRCRANANRRTSR